ncbi:MAG: hypothetical protein C0594_13680 [Marinilabiliales bacterium]|nr:MAG: hypothetical protein C0594_13680 [Marinilabiliales bacterium]
MVEKVIINNGGTQVGNKSLETILNEPSQNGLKNLKDIQLVEKEVVRRVQTDSIYLPYQDTVLIHDGDNGFISEVYLDSINTIGYTVPFKITENRTGDDIYDVKILIKNASIDSTHIDSVRTGVDGTGTITGLAPGNYLVSWGDKAGYLHMNNVELDLTADINHLEDTLYAIQNHTLPKTIDKVTADPADTNTVAMTGLQFWEKASGHINMTIADNDTVHYFVRSSWDAERATFDLLLDSVVNQYFPNQQVVYTEVFDESQAELICEKGAPQTTVTYGSSPNGYPAVIKAVATSNTTYSSFAKEHIERANHSGNVTSRPSVMNPTAEDPDNLDIRIRVEEIYNDKNIIQNGTETTKYKLCLKSTFN